MRSALALLSLVTALSSVSATAQSFSINSFNIGNDGGALAMTPVTNYYFTLYEGESASTLTNLLGVFRGGPEGSIYAFPPRDAAETGRLYIYAVLGRDGCDPGDGDQDGINDYYELSYIGLNPNDPSDALEDSDGDGASNYWEYRSLTEPGDPTDVLCAFVHPYAAWQSDAADAPTTGDIGFDVAPLVADPFRPADADSTGVAHVSLDGDALIDAAAVGGTQGVVTVFLAEADGRLGAAVPVATGHPDPRAVVAADLVGDNNPDLAVAHGGGQVVLLEGNGDGTFLLRPELTVSNLGAVVSLVTLDVDGDGDNDLVTSGGDQAQVLWNEDSPQPVSPLLNADFDAGLADWMTLATGQSPGSPVGGVSAQHGQAVMEEGESFLVSVRQTFPLPLTPGELTVSLAAIGLSPPAFGLPDVVQISLVDAAGISLVPSLAGQNAVLNLNPGGNASTAPGTLFDGTNLVIDLSGLVAGTDATIDIALLGNPNGNDGSVALESVAISPAVVANDTFTAVALPGPLVDTAGIGWCDLLGGMGPELIVDDAGAGVLVVYEYDGVSAFIRTELDPIAYGRENDIGDPGPPISLTAPASARAGASAKFLVADAVNGTVYRHDAIGDVLASVATPAADTTGIAADATGRSFWTIDARHNRVRAFSPDGMQTGAWAAWGLSHPSGIAWSVGDLWVVDKGTRQLACYIGGADLAEGEADPDLTFPLDAANPSPSGVTVAEDLLWVVDDQTDAVFAYAVDGTVRAGWALDPANTDASGITHSGMDLWVVDRADRRVYRYADALTFEGAALTAAGSFPLHPENLAPEGIADPPTPIALNQVVTNDVNTIPGGTNQFSFAGSAGQRVFIDVLSGSRFDFEWSLEELGGAVVASDNNWDDGGPLTLATGGDYLFNVIQSGSDTGEVQFVVYEVPDPVTTGTNANEVVTGSIDVPGEEDVFLIPFSAPAALYGDVVSGSQFNFTWELRDPSGQAVLPFQNFRDEPVFGITTSGVYQLVIDGTGDHVGSYSFAWYTVPDNPVQTISTNDSVTGTIAIPGEVQTYEVELSAPLSLYADALSGSRFSYDWELYDPFGAEVWGLRDFTDQHVLDLTHSGTYQLTVDGTGDAVGSFTFQLNVVPSNPPETMLLDQRVEGELTVPGELQTYELFLSDPVTIYADAVSGGLNSFSWSMLDPVGGTVFSQGNFSDRGPFTVTEPGVYTVMVDGRTDSTGAFSFQLYTVPEDTPIPLDLGFVVEGEITVPGETDSYSILLSAGQTVFIDPLVGGINTFEWRLIGPDESVFLSRPNWTSRGPEVVPATGIYTFIADGRITGTGFYSIVVDVVPQHPVGTLPLNTPRTGSFTAAGEIWEYTFDVVAGESNRFEFIHNENSAARLEVIRPDGSTAFGNMSNNRSQTFAQTGAYTGRVTSSNFQMAQFSLWRTTDPASPIPDGPDLVADIAFQPGRLVDTPATVDISWTVTNTGSNTTTNAWTDRLILSTLEDLEATRWAPVASAVSNGVLSELPGVQVIAIEERLAPGNLAPGHSYTQSVSVVFPDEFEGTFFVHAWADASNQVYELDEENNRFHREELTAIFPRMTTAGTDGLLQLDLEDGDAFPVGEPVTLSGQARGVPEQVNIYYVIDVSASTANPTGLDANFDGNLNDQDDINGDNREGDIYDVELGSIRVINRLLLDQGVVPTVAYIPFAGDGDRTDFSPDMLAQVFWDPIRDRDGDGESDFEEFTLGIPTYFGTDFDFPNEELVRLLAIAPDAAQTEIFYFTDGEANPPNTNLIAEIASYGVNFSAFQIDGNQVSASLQTVADGVDAGTNSTGQAILVSDPNDLATAVINTLDIAGVSVDGRGVARLDGAGNFFTPLRLVPGEQTVEIAAFDSEGNSFSRFLTLIGLTGPGDPANFQAVDVLGTPRFRNLFHNPVTAELTAELLIENTSPFPIPSPLLAVFDAFTPAAVSLLNADGTLDSGAPYLSFDAEITGNELAPDASTGAAAVQIANAEALRFDISLSLRAPANQPPYFVSLPPVDAIAGRAWTYAAEAEDANQDPLVFNLPAGPVGMSVDTNTGAIAWSPGVVDTGTHPVILQVKDGRGGSAQQSFRLTVYDTTPNRPPVFQTFPPIQVASGGDFAYTPSVYDPDGDLLSYTLPLSPGGTVFNGTNGMTSLPAPADGAYNFTLEVTDGNGGLARQAFTVNVGTNNAGNGAPTFLSIPPIYALVDLPYVYLPLVVDPDGEDLSFTLLNGPSNLTMNATNGLVEWQPTALNLGAHPVQLQVTDTAGHEANQFFAIEVVAEAANLAPLVVSVPENQATVDQEYAYDVRATDPEGLAVSYHLDQGPAGMTLDAGTGELRWTPNLSDLGPHTVSLHAEDPSGLSGFQGYSLAVKGSNLPPIFVSTPLTEAPVGARYQYRAEATDTEDEIQYFLTDGPSGMGVNAGTGVVDWQPVSGDAGSHPVRIEARDERGLPAFQDYLLEVVPDTVPPVVTVIASPNLRAPGEFVDLRVVAVDNVAIDTNLITLTANGSPLPLDASGEASFTTNEVALVEFVGSATDINGNTGVGSTEVRFYDSGDTNPPVLVVSAPLNQGMVTAPTNVIGSAYDPDGVFDYYTLEWAPVDSLAAAPGSGGMAFLLSEGDFTLFHRGEDPVTNGVLGTFDPTLLPNDDYVIRATAWDINGQGRQEGVLISVSGDLKLGQFAYSFVDLEIPLAGIPIKITRAYNSLTAGDRGDFGFGWTLSVADAHIRETVPDNGLGFFGANPFYDGARVYLDTPEGKRVGFTFRLQPSQFSPYLGQSYIPVFEADPGVTYTLEANPPQPKLSQRGDGAAILFGVPFAYNPERYRLTSKDGITFLYNQNDGLESISDPGGNVITYTGSGLVHSAGMTIAFTRDAENRITEIRDPDGESIRYEYDSAGDLVAMTAREGGRSEYRYEANIPHYLSSFTDAAGRVPVQTEYDEDGRISAIIDENGNRQEQTFDPAGFRGTMSDFNGNIVELQYDALGNLILETDPLGNANHYQYDVAGNLTRFTDRNGNVTAYTYDAAGNRLSESNAVGEITQWTYDDRGRITSTTFPDASISSTVYDSSGKAVLEIDRTGASTSTLRHANGQEEEVTDANGHQTRYERNAALLPSAQILPDGTTNVFEYTSSGKLLRALDHRGLLFEIDTNKDALPTDFRDALGNGYHWEYDAGRVTEVRDQNGNSAHFVYDAIGNILAVTNRNGDTSSFTYDGNANRVTLLDALGNLTSNAYNEVNRHVLEVDAAGAMTQMRYDPEGNVTNRVDRNGREVHYDYDAVHRLVQETWFETGGVVNVISYTYDQGDRPTRVSDFNATFEFDYDAEGRLIEERRIATNGLPAVAFQWAYDPVGNMTNLVDNSGVQVEVRYDASNREVDRIWSGGAVPGARVSRTWYDVYRESLQLRYADTSASTLVGQTIFEYDLARRLEHLRHTDSGGSDLVRYDYAADPVNQITNWTHHGESTDLGYDTMGQVLSATGGLNEAFSYDAMGNRALPGYVVDAANRLTADDAFTYSYDGEGNVTQRVAVVGGQQTHYAYDHRNRLVHVERLDNTGTLLSEADYHYDALDRRIVSDVDGMRTLHTYADEQLWSDADGTGVPNTWYLTGPKSDELLARYRTADGLAWYLADHNRSVHDLADATGGLTTHYDYTLFGERVTTTNPGMADRFGFAGREFEPVSGAQHFRARMYDPLTGRFLSEDPLRFLPGDLNLYRYAGNNPLGANDPSGTIAAITYADIACTISGAILTVAPGYTTFLTEVFAAVVEGLNGGTPTSPNFPAPNPLGLALPCGLGGLL